MALDPNITGTDQDDYLVATPGTNVIDAGAGNDMIETVDGDNTILFDAGSGLDTLTFAPARSYQYAGLLEEAQTALAALTGVTGPVTDEYFGTLVPGVLVNTLPWDIRNVLRRFKPVGVPGDDTPPPLGMVDAEVARQTMDSLIAWINAPSQDVIQLGEGITRENLSVQVLDSTPTNFGVPNQFQVSINGQDGLIFQLGRPDFVAEPTTGSASVPPVPVTFRFADGTTISLSELLSSNHDPVVAMPFVDQHATQDAAFSFQIPEGTFTDPDVGDALTLSASTVDANGDAIALPAWLTFDPLSGSFSGTPTNDDVGALSVIVTASDSAGAKISTPLTIEVANVNDAPVGMPTITGSATEDQTLTADVSAISDADGLGAFNYQWLRNGAAIDSATASTYKLGDADVGAQISVQVGYSDGHGTAESVASAPTDAVANVNDAPVGMPAVIGIPTKNQTLTADTASISDADGLGTLNYRWLRNGVVIDNATAKTYTLGDADVGAKIGVQIGYVDGHGTSETLTSAPTAAVADINHAPELMTPIADQSAVVGNAFSLTVPATVFRDVDVGDTMTLAAMMANGNALPSWLVFDAASRTLHGTPGAGAIGTMNLKIVATDAAGASMSDPFAMNISAPPVTLPPPTQGGTFVGGNGNDRLTGGAGNDVLQGNRGRDLLSGGNGDDKLYFSDDASWSLFATRRNNGSPGHSGTSDTISIAGKRQSQDILDGGAGNDTLIGTGRSDAILLDDTSSPAQGSGPRIVGIERIEAGAGNDVVDLTSRRYAYGNVTIDGGSGNDVLWSSSGNDVLLGDSGNDRMDGGAGNDYLNGGTGRDAVDGGEGVDALQGGSGRDELRDTSGNGLLDGGSGDDRLTGGSNNVLFIGGKGDDTVRLGSGSNVVAFDRGDGRDVIQSESGGTSTLSLGAGIRLQDLAFRRSGDNLILETGNNESITFDNWYRSRSNQAFTKLQFVTEGMTGPGGSTELDDKIETFDFRKLVGAFDSARARNPGLSRWALTNSLASFHLDNVHNNSKALGGDLAYAYGTAGSLAGIGLGAAQDVLTSAQFGKESQALHPVSGLKEGLVKLA